jgi:glycyl-tRNA synthetase beta chain
LGSVFEKTERIAALAGHMAELLGADVTAARRAGLLSKADLATSMVYEFADMQGIAGRYYAQNDGETTVVAQALSEQYLPKFATDELPQTAVGAILALADRLDTLAGIFGLGEVPTGSKDPFGLRRASVAVLRILVEKQLPLDLRELLSFAVGQYAKLPKGAESIDLALAYMLERFRAWYEERNIPAEIYQAVSAKGLTCPLDIDNRVHAVANFYRLPQASALAAANKRVSNILAKLDTPVVTAVNSALLQEPAEKVLAEQIAGLQAEVAPMFARRDYSQALATLAGLRDAVDRFFDDVMVNCDDPALRNNRLALLQSLRDLFWEVADISCLAVSK